MPPDWGSSAWLPARALSLGLDGMPADHTLRVGQPLDLTMTLQATGLPYEALPALSLPDLDLATDYPDKHVTATLNDGQKQRFAAPERPSGARSPSRGDIARMCDLPASTDAPIRQIERAVQPTAAQRKSLEELQRKAGEMGQFLLASCLAPMADAPAQRLDAATDRLTALVFAISNVNIALNDFTSRLSDDQKAKLDSITR